MGLSDLGWLRWPSPLLDDAVTVDAFAGAAVDEAAGPGRLALTLASGTRLQAELTVPVEGVLRIRVAERLGPPRPSPMLVEDLAATPAGLAEGAGAIRVDGAGVTGEWATEGGGLAVGPWCRAAGAEALTGTIGGAGRLVEDGRPVGWVETARLGPDSAVYGSGESFQGPGLRGRIRRIVNVETHGASGLDASYLNVPFFWSDDGWGLFAHSAGPVRADLGATHADAAALALEGDELDLFVVAGDAPTLLRRYLACTGHPGALPEWAFGVWTSRCSYLSEKEIHAVLDEYEAAGCPVDVVHVDAWVAGNVLADLACNWEVDRQRFPEGWAARLRERGVATSLWHNPYVVAGTPLAAALAERGLLLRRADGSLAVTPDKVDRHAVDFTAPAAVAWWKEQVRSTMAAEGNVAFKPDFAEEVPEDAVFHDGRTGRQARNEYAVRYQAATHEAMAEVAGESEVALFCRSGTAGAQRYPCHWVGDSPSTWAGMAAALRACLSLSLSGFAFATHDIGGFWTPESFDPLQEAFEEMDGSGLVADVDPVLFARWAQWGALSPVMRFHGTARREPVAYPEPARSVAIEACRLRKRLQAYLVEAARVASAEGTPMTRPMVLAYPGDRAARDADLQYLLGPDVLVAPVLSPDGRRRLWVPPGRWEPLWGLAPVEGPGWHEVACPLESFPAWVRRGAPWPLHEFPEDEETA